MWSVLLYLSKIHSWLLKTQHSKLSGNALRDTYVVKYPYLAKNIYLFKQFLSPLVLNIGVVKMSTGIKNKESA